MERTAYARLVRKGEPDAFFAHSVALGVLAHSPLLEGGAPCLGGALSWVAHFRYLNVGTRGTVCTGDVGGSTLKTTQREAGLDATISHVFDLPVVSVEVGGMAGVLGVLQEFQTDGKAPARTALGPSAGLFGRATVDVWRFLFVGADVELRSALLPKAAQDRIRNETPGTFGGGVSVGAHL